MTRSDHLETTLNHVPSALFLLDPDRVIVHRNRAAEKLAPPLKVGMDLWTALGPITGEEKVDRIMRGERLLFQIAPDLPVLEWMIAVDRPPDGSLVLMAWDTMITDEILQRRTTFVVGASHELRSPLTALLGFSEILELEIDSLTPQQAEAVTVIRRNSQHLQSMVDDIIDLSKNSFGDLSLELETIDPTVIIEGVPRSMRPRIEARQQTLTVDISDSLPPIMADPRRLRQIITNLIQNAHAHNPPGTAIEVSATASSKDLIIRVADDGDGLAFDDPEDAFTSFRRGSTTDDALIAGSGIGLAIIRRMVELHRGTVTVETGPGEGSTFEVRLPRDYDQAKFWIVPGNL